MSAVLSCCLLAALAACSPTPQPDAPTGPSPAGTDGAELPRLVIGNPGTQDVMMHARGSGVVVVLPGGCIGVESTVSAALAVFPPGTTIERTADAVVVSMPDGGTVSTGSEVTFGGGGYAPEQFEAVLPPDVPAECLTDRAVQVASILG